VLILGSASPRRRELLGLIAPRFEVVPSDVDERLDPGDLGAAVTALAMRKARAVARGRVADVVLGADTLVVLDGVAMGKPTGADDARSMLRRLRGRTHEVVTGVAVVDAASGRAATRTVVSRVSMAACSDADIDAYVATGEPLDKAGAYAVQGLGGRLVNAVDGSYSNVVGLPLQATRELLVEFGVAQRDEPATAFRSGSR
jgi:septum formation protein